MKRWISVMLAAAMLIMALAACGASAPMDMVATESSTAVSNGYYADEMAKEEIGMIEVEEEAEMEYAAGAGGVELNADAAEMPQDGRKIIRNTSLTIETKAFNESVSLLKQAVSTAGGYVEYSSQYTGGRTRSAEYICRVPADSYTVFLESVQGAGSVVRTEESTEDATAQYVDLEARLKSLRTQEERLLELMEESGSLEDLLAVQNQLMEVQYQIESYTGQMKALSNRIDYATVTVYLEEVEVYTPVEPTFIQRIDNAFTDMLLNVQDGAEGLVLAVIYLIPLWIFAGVVVIVVVVIVKRRKKKQPKPVPPYYPPVPPQSENTPKE